MFGTFPTLNQELLGHAGFRSADTSSLVRFINQVAPPDMQRALQEALPQRDPGLRLRLHRARRDHRPERSGRDARRSARRPAARRSRGSRCASSIPTRGHDVADRRARRDRRPRLRDVRGLPQRPGADRRGDRRRRLVPHGRHRQRRRRTAGSPSTGARRTCSRSAARTSPRSRSSRTSARHPAVRLAQVVEHPRRAADRGAGGVRRGRAGPRGRARRS